MFLPVPSVAIGLVTVIISESRVFELFLWMVKFLMMNLLSCCIKLSYAYPTSLFLLFFAQFRMLLPVPSAAIGSVAVIAVRHTTYQ